MNRFYRFARAVEGTIYRLGGARIIGQENIPQDPSLLIICNHVSFGDPPALAMAFPRQITFIAKEGFAQNPLTRWLFSALGAVFLKKEESDLGAMRVTMNALRGGNVVAIFPEGMRRFNQELGEFKQGASYIAQRSHVRVLPVAVLNTGDIFRFWKRNVLVLIGEAIDPPQGEKPEKELLAKNTALYRERVAELVEQGKAQLAREGRQMRQPPHGRADASQKR